MDCNGWNGWKRDELSLVSGSEWKWRNLFDEWLANGVTAHLPSTFSFRPATPMHSLLVFHWEKGERGGGR